MIKQEIIKPAGEGKVAGKEKKMNIENMKAKLNENKIEYVIKKGSDESVQYLEIIAPYAHANFVIVFKNGKAKQINRVENGRYLVDPIELEIEILFIKLKDKNLLVLKNIKKYSSKIYEFEPSIKEEQNATI